MTTGEDIKRWLSMLPEHKRKLFTLRTKSEVGTPHLYHISRNHDITSFSPNVSTRTLLDEDRSIPRICTATSLAGCLLGYQSQRYDFETSEYKGWYIYGIPYRYAIRPTAELLPDVGVSDEHWLVTFDPSTVEYLPVVVGKFFFNKKESVHRFRRLISEYHGYLDVIAPEGLRLTDGVHAPRGIYDLRYMPSELSTHKSTGGLKIGEVSRGEYIAVRNTSVELLSRRNRPLRGSELW